MALRKFGTGTLIAIAIAGMLLTATTAGLLTTTQTLTSTGSITPAPTPTPTPTSTPISTVGVAIYSNAALTTPMTSITWGPLAPGGQTTVTVYIKNTGNIPETLSMTPSGWTPSNANTYLTCTWNPTSTTIAAGASTQATITLTASASATATSFSVNIIITGTQ